MKSTTMLAALAFLAATSATRADESAADRATIDVLVSQYADEYQVPEDLIHRVIKRESGYRPGARNGPYWGLMQIRHDTAGTMGYRGPASGLLDASTNLRYAVKYLAGAYKVAEGKADQAVRFYARGFYYDAKRKGLLEETGLRPARKSDDEVVTGSVTPTAVGGLY